MCGTDQRGRGSGPCYEDIQALESRGRGHATPTGMRKGSRDVIGQEPTDAGVGEDWVFSEELLVAGRVQVGGSPVLKTPWKQCTHATRKPQLCGRPGIQFVEMVRLVLQDEAGPSLLPSSLALAQLPPAPPTHWGLVGRRAQQALLGKSELNGR